MQSPTVTNASLHMLNTLVVAPELWQMSRTDFGNRSDFAVLWIKRRFVYECLSKHLQVDSKMLQN